MKTRTIATLTALTLAAFAGTSARAEDTAVTLEWQQPGYVMDVVVVTAPRPTAVMHTAAPAATAHAAAAPGETSTLARLEPGYVEEVVVVTASRSEAIAELRAAARQIAMARAALMSQGGSWKNWAGMPVR
jgi:hypothetical protein